MVIELFTLSDGAFNYNGKLTIVGALTSITPDRLPTRIRIAMALRIRVYSEDVGEKLMIISFIDSEGKKLPVDLNVNLKIVPTTEPVSYISFAADLQGLPLEVEGGYKVLIEIDGKLLQEYPFVVKKR